MISGYVDICINFMGRTKTKPFFEAKKGAETLLSLLVSIFFK
jgi:hypothetical protein